MATTNGTTNGGPGASKRRVSENLVHSMTLKTCGGELAATLRELYPSFHRDTGAESIKLTVDYADTLVEGNTYDKVIVAIHGTPGYYTHFDKIIQHFRDTNVRVIAPNLPSFADTRRTKAFWHTTLEKGQFLKDFLARLNITTIDCLISHSFGIQTIATLWENPGDIQIKSVCMFAPQPLWDFESDKIEQLLGAFRYRNEVWYNFISLIKVHKMPSMPMKFDHVNEFLVFATVVIDQKHRNELYKRVEALMAMVDVPVTVCYGSKESLIPKVTIGRLYKELGIEDVEHEVINIDPETDSPEQLAHTRRIMGYTILGGKHFAHASFPQYSNRMIEQLLEYQAAPNDTQPATST